MERRFECEIRAIQQLHHPRIVQFVDLFTDDMNYYIIMEFCLHGELFHYIIKRDHLYQSEAKLFVRQVFAHVHAAGICQRDLKPENLLLDRCGRVKISDFGMSRFVAQLGLVDTPRPSASRGDPTTDERTKSGASVSSSM
jgi:serine/threonine protein kinase